MLGQAAGRINICFEKIGLNWIQSDHPDERGRHLTTGPILTDQPLAIMTQFPVDDVVKKLKIENLPVEVSFSAGSFVCNDLYFRALVEFSEKRPVFVHVPLVKDLDYDIQLNVLKKTVSELLLAQSDKIQE